MSPLTYLRGSGEGGLNTRRFFLLRFPSLIFRMAYMRRGLSLEFYGIPVTPGGELAGIPATPGGELAGYPL